MSSRPILQMPASSPGPRPVGESGQPPQTDHECLEQAAQWYATLHADDVTETQRLAWQHWLEDPAHHAAWQKIETVGQRLRALQHGQDAMAVAGAIQAGRRPDAGRRQLVRGLLLLPVAGVAGWAAWQHTPLRDTLIAHSADFHTGRGGVREVRLEDGTQVWLNTATALNRDYRADRRALQLLMGEILVQTAVDSRPFTVQTSHGVMQALGTRFSVRQQQAWTELAVYQGAVEIRLAGSAGSRVLQAGTRTRFDASAIAPVEPTDDAQLGWMRGILVANDMPLAHLLDELSRHHYVHFAVAPDVAGLRVMGTYSLRNLPQTLDLLQASLPLRISQPMPWWVSVQAQ